MQSGEPKAPDIFARNESDGLKRKIENKISSIMAK